MTSENSSGEITSLPAGVGRAGLAYYLASLVLLSIVAFGVFCYSQQLRHGDIVTGMRTIGQGGPSWGLYIIFVVYFIGVSFAGISVAALIRLFGIEQLRPLSRMAELLTICALIVGACTVLADLGQPLHGLLNLPRYARISSPFFGTFTLVVGGYLFSSLVYFFLAARADAAACVPLARNTPHRLFYRAWATGFKNTPAEHARHKRASFWLSLTILPLLLTAHSTLGFIFGIQGGRPGWFSALQAPGFVVLAGISGIGVLIVIAALTRRLLGLEDVIRTESFKWLGNLLWILIVGYLYFMIVEELTANYAAAEIERHLAHEIVFGTYAPMFWTVVLTFVSALIILFLQFVMGRTSIALTVIAALLVNVGAIFKRFIIVIPSLTHGMLLPYKTGHYTPSWTEIGVITGLFALATFLYITFIKLFPLIPQSHHVTRDAAMAATESRGRTVFRSVLFACTLLLGITLAVTGFLASARFGTKPYMDPVIPFSPVVFIVGIMLSFGSAVVYETLPWARKA